MQTDPLQYKLKEHLYLKDGTFYVNKVRRGTKSLHSPVGSVVPDGYVHIRFNNKYYKAHRLVWLYEHGRFPAGEIDHINGNRADNRIENLREIGRCQNMQNQRKARSDNASGFLGVHKKGSKFQAIIRVNGRSMYLGIFETPEKAHEAYIEAKRIYHPGGTL